jgi:NAD(P)-dependent dehydrogenase (short-subunit alcohol dehydrogenase family)
MIGRIIVLGAAGRIGRAAAEAFRDAGWSVASQVRASAAPTWCCTRSARPTRSGRSLPSPRRMPRLLSPVVPIFRELTEVAYLWNKPHRIDGGKLAATIGEVQQARFETAVAAALDDLGLIGRRRGR